MKKLPVKSEIRVKVLSELANYNFSKGEDLEKESCDDWIFL